MGLRSSKVIKDMCSSLCGCFKKTSGDNSTGPDGKSGKNNRPIRASTNNISNNQSKNSNATIPFDIRQNNDSHSIRYNNNSSPNISRSRSSDGGETKSPEMERLLNISSKALLRL